MPTIDYLPVATSGTANVDPQSSFAGSPYQENGFVDGIASPQQANKIWRQASMVGAAFATFISNILNISVLDDGNLVGLTNNFYLAVIQLIQTATAGLQTALGFTPVQQGTGVGQLSNTVKLGWNGAALLCSIDATNAGTFVFQDNLNSVVATQDAENTFLQTEINTLSAEVGILSFAGQTLAQQGHQVFPAAPGHPPLIMIWGTITADINGGQLAVSFAPSGVTFPNNCFNVQITTESPTDRITYIVNGSISKNGFTAGNNGSSGFATWFAIGN